VTLSTGTGRNRRKRRRPSILGWVVGALLAIVVFAVGIAVGQALEDRPQPAEPVTSVATIQPWTQTGGRTVTVTVTKP
jgi:hypothetical protein